VLRKALMQSRRQEVTHFRWRGGDVSRLEGFSDAVFGFALTLLVVSLEVPATFDQLAAVMKSMPAFAICFIMLVFVWYDHYLFFRRYGLRDTWTLTLNMILLFLVMFYVFPLKFLFSLLVRIFSGEFRNADGSLPIRNEQMPDLMIIYATGFAAIYLVYLLLYHHAYRNRFRLDLNKLEVFDTKSGFFNHLGMVAIGAISVSFALTRTAQGVSLAGMTFWLIGIFQGTHGTVAGRMRRRLEEDAKAEASLDAAPAEE